MALNFYEWSTYHLDVFVLTCARACNAAETEGGWGWWWPVCFRVEHKANMFFALTGSS